MAFANDRAKTKGFKRMTNQEFKARTPFLDETDHEYYADWFEPAYMGARAMDKDDFCIMLKIKSVRKFVQSVSEAFRANEAIEKDLSKQLTYEMACNRELRSKIDGLRKNISLIQATCDRAIA